MTAITDLDVALEESETLYNRARDAAHRWLFSTIETEVVRATGATSYNLTRYTEKYWKRLVEFQFRGFLDFVDRNHFRNFPAAEFRATVWTIARKINPDIHFGLMGHSYLESGFVYAPNIPLQITQLVDDSIELDRQEDQLEQALQTNESAIVRITQEDPTRF